MLMLFQPPFGSLPHLSKQLSDAIQREAKQVDGIDVPHFRWRATNIDGPQENFQQISSMQMGILCLSEFPVDLFFCTQKKTKNTWVLTNTHILVELDVGKRRLDRF